MSNENNSAFRLERKGDDFPFYAGKPVTISGPGWVWILLAVAAGFAILVAPPPFLRSPGTALLRAVLYSAIPLAMLAWVSRGHWTALFRRIRLTDIGLILLFLVLTWIVTLAVGALIINLFESSANPAAQSAVAADAGGRALFFARTGIQLFGEEVFTILPFLALLWWSTAKLGLSRKSGIVLAWLVTAVMFALAHLPTYDWHLAQALLGVGVVRLVLTLPYIMTKNIWVSAGVHILNDWAIFGLPMLVASSTG